MEQSLTRKTTLKLVLEKLTKLHDIMLEQSSDIETVNMVIDGAIPVEKNSELVDKPTGLLGEINHTLNRMLSIADETECRINRLKSTVA